jgi:hypothetical protein
MKGIYQHCSETHLQRYLDEFSFRYSYRIRLGVDDSERTGIAIQGAEGKRLTYRRTRSQEAADEVPFQAALARRLALSQADPARTSLCDMLRAGRGYRPLPGDDGRCPTVRAFYTERERLSMTLDFRWRRTPNEGYSRPRPRA